MLKGFKIGSAAVGIAFIVGLVAFLFNRVGNLKEAAQVRDQEIYRLEWLLSAKEAELDTLKGMGQYSVPGTTWVKRPVVPVVPATVATPQVDPVYEDIPTIYGSIEIDTTTKLGPESNPLEVRVWGRFWYPEEYSGRNRMLIHPVAGTPYKPVTPRSPDKWALGLVYIRLVSAANLGYAGDYLGASVRYKRLTLSAAYDPWRKGGIGGIGFKVLGF